MKTAALTVTTPSEREVVMTREFNAARGMVFDALTKPDLLRRWLLGPPGWTMPVCEIHLRVCGHYRSAWRQGEAGMQKMATCPWSGGKGEAAALSYTSILKHSKILNGSRYGDAGPGPKGSVMVVSFQREGQQFTGLNGGPQFKFSEAVSFVV